MQIVLIKQAEKELRDAPKEVLLNMYSLFDELSRGVSLRMPISRPLPSIYKGLHELRFSSKSGEYRVFYFIKINDAVYIIHAAFKKKQALDKKTSELLLKRIRSIES